ncbi:hypothetical protein [Proteus hauseri]|uniref:hypothetical protein n=1 Tax=Proteus hauseri TaxID=183417 RepID=UPI0032DBA14F
MELLKKEYIANTVTLFDVRLSEGEITLYADCLDLIMKVCTDEQIFSNTECVNKEEISWYRDNLIQIIKTMENKDFLPDRYKNL